MDMRRYAASALQNKESSPFIEIYCLDCNPGHEDAVVIWTGKHVSMYKVVSAITRHEMELHSKNKEN